MTVWIDTARAAAVSAITLASVALAAPALAADDNALPQAAMIVHDADFASPRAVAHLKRHLRHVAMTACVPNASSQMFLSRSEQACYQTALQDGLRQIDSRQQAIRDRTVRLADARAHTNAAE
jgi:UrcA family protein